MRAHAGPVTGRQDPHQADAPHGWAATRPARRPETRRVPVPRGAAARRQGPVVSHIGTDILQVVTGADGQAAAALYPKYNETGPVTVTSPDFGSVTFTETVARHWPRRNRPSGLRPRAGPP
jgi:hypothetical protein